MICFVNAKINCGLQIVRRRPDGYHDLQTLFYPIGLYSGLPENPQPFCDLLEVTSGLPTEPSADFQLLLSGRPVACPPEKNLVFKAAKMFYDRYQPDIKSLVHLEKHLPDGAGIGGGSADAAFTLRMLAELTGCGTPVELAEMALCLGADCPFFLLNRPAYAAGVGEKLTEVPLDLSGHWLVLVKPDLYISTREAFAGVTPRPAAFDLRELSGIPVSDWRDLVHNDFEDSLFPQFPLLQTLKSSLYDCGALYASLTGSGSCVYGIFADHATASEANARFNRMPTITASYLLKL